MVSSAGQDMCKADASKERAPDYKEDSTASLCHGHKSYYSYKFGQEKIIKDLN